MIDKKELDEAHKVGDKVVIKHPSKDIKGKTGRIGEIRKGLYKGAPKTFTVDYDHNETTGQAKSVQLKSKHISGVKEQVENLQEKHRVSVTLSDPHHPAVTKRKELIQKTVRVKADNPGHAVDSAIHHFRRAGYKVHDHHYIGTVKEGAMPTFKEMDEATQIDEISKELAGNYVGALAKKQLDKHGMKPNMYDKLPKKHQKGFDRAIDRLKEESELEEGRGTADKHWNIAQGHKEKADIAHDKSSRHAHLANYHDSMSRYHEELGQHSLAQSHADKAEINHEKSLEKHEEVAANNVGGGNIAGTQGDAGKKAVMTKKPLKRQVVQFKEFAEAVDKDPCWKNYKMVGMKDKNGKKVPNCVPKESVEIDEAAIDAKGHKSSTGGLTQKGVDAYNRANPGHHLQTAVTTPPSKLDPDSKAAKRRKSFCARMSGVDGPMKDEKGRPTRKALALRKWNC